MITSAETTNVNYLEGVYNDEEHLNTQQSVSSDVIAQEGDTETNTNGLPDSGSQSITSSEQEIQAAVVTPTNPPKGQPSSQPKTVADEKKRYQRSPMRSEKYAYDKRYTHVQAHAGNGYDRDVYEIGRFQELFAGQFELFRKRTVIFSTREIKDKDKDGRPSYIEGVHSIRLLSMHGLESLNECWYPDGVNSVEEQLVEFTDGIEARYGELLCDYRVDQDGNRIQGRCILDFLNTKKEVYLAMLQFIQDSTGCNIYVARETLHNIRGVLKPALYNVITRLVYSFIRQEISDGRHVYLGFVDETRDSALFIGSVIRVTLQKKYRQYVPESELQEAFDKGYLTGYQPTGDNHIPKGVQAALRCHDMERFFSYAPTLYDELMTQRDTLEEGSKRWKDLSKIGKTLEVWQQWIDADMVIQSYEEAAKALKGEKDLTLGGQTVTVNVPSEEIAVCA